MNRIKLTRLVRERSQKEIALTVGVAQPTVSAWENGKKSPSLENLKKLAQIYDVSMDYLAGVSEDPLLVCSPITVPQSKISSIEALELMEEMQQRINEVLARAKEEGK